MVYIQYVVYCKDNGAGDDNLTLIPWADLCIDSVLGYNQYDTFSVVVHGAFGTAPKIPSGSFALPTTTCARHRVLSQHPLILLVTDTCAA